MSVRSIAALALMLVPGCYASGTPDGGSSAADAGDGAVRFDGTVRFDGSVPDDAPPECFIYGDLRMCGSSCPHPCPADRSWCGGDDICYSGEEEECRVSLEGGGTFCASGGFCAADEVRWRLMGRTGGRCFSESYCRYLQDGGGDPERRCRYSEGQPYVDGPPDVPCGTGAWPEGPFCGPTCGACPANLWDPNTPPGCVGVSEERGFGVCAPYPWRCSPEGGVNERALMQCETRLTALGGWSRCACMLFEPPGDPAFADHGWPVAAQSCLAYRDHFPGQVRCMDASWNELE